MAASDESEEYQRALCSFQSTSSCNIETVNALNSIDVSVRRRERGRSSAGNKRVWGIEMNEAREMYLETYSRIDSIDHLIKNARMSYRSWKYWHSPMIHGKSLAVVTAYDMYLEVATGDLDPHLKIEKPMDFHTFRERLSEQMLQYNPTLRCYPGDQNMRVSTKQIRAERPRAPSHSEDGVTLEQFRAATTGEGNDQLPRLCGDLSLLMLHIESLDTSLHHPKKCCVCGEDCYAVCKVCSEAVHQPFAKKGKLCFFDRHNDAKFGLCRCDQPLLGKRKKDWTPPTNEKKAANAEHIAELKNHLHD